MMIATRPDNGTDFSLEELQGIVGGYIQIVECPDDMIMVVNEEGLFLNLPVNPVASLFARQYIVGDVLFCRKDQVR